MEVVRRGSERSPSLSAAAMRLFEREGHVLRHPVLRLNDDRAEWNVVGIRSAAVVHRHAEEASSAVGLDIGRQLLQVATKRFFTLIQTADGLKPRFSNPT